MKNSSGNAEDFFMRERQKSWFGRLQWVYLVVAIFLVLGHIALYRFTPIHTIESKVTDLFFQSRTPLQTHSDIVLIEIDQASIDSIGKLPWPQHYYAQIIRILDKSKVRAIALSVFLDDAPAYSEEDLIKDALEETQVDVYMPVRLEPKKEKKIWVHSLPVVIEPEGQGVEWVFGLADLSQSVQGMGHVNVELDGDGVLRRIKPFVDGNDQVYAHYMMPLAYKMLGQNMPSRYAHDFPLTPEGSLLINWSGKWKESFPRYSFSDVVRSHQMTQKGSKPLVDLRELENKTVLIGFSEGEKSVLLQTPLKGKTPEFVIDAYLLQSFLKQDWVSVTQFKESAACMLGFGFLMILFFVFFRLRISFSLALLAFIGWVITAFTIFSSKGILIPVANIGLMTLTIFIFSVIYYQLISAKEQTRLFDLATRDGLTGLYVIRHFREILNRIVGEVIQTKEPLSLILLDIDNFKPINDTYGHPAGDEILKETAQVIYSCLRSRRKEQEVDYVGRYGGEEFIVLLRQVELKKAAEIVAERIRSAIEREDFRWQGTSIPVTVSVGVSTLLPGETVPDAMVHRADEALYEAKRTGKNKVCSKS